MAAVNSDDGYSDDDLDALPADEFLKLQDLAISTQQNQHFPRLPTLKGTGIGNLPGLNNKSKYSQAQQYLDHASSDYGDLDDEILDIGLLNDSRSTLVGLPRHDALYQGIGESQQQEQWIQRGFDIPQPPHGKIPQASIHPGLVTHDPQDYNAIQTDCAAHDAEEDMLDASSPIRYGKQSIDNTQINSVDALQAKVTELLQERETLQREVKTANDELLAKTGEISIVRANQAKKLREHERQLSELQRHHAETVSRQKSEVDNARAEREKIATENRFLQRDLTEEARKAKQTRRATKGLDERNGNGGNIVTTPKKNRAVSFADGFDEEEVQNFSQTKLALRPKVSSPKNGTKRKRKPIEESPVQPLRLSSPAGDTLPDAPTIEIPNIVAAEESIVNNDDGRFHFFQKFLNHRIKHDDKRSLELLSELVFPSEPQISLSAVFLDKLSLLSMEKDSEDLPAAIGTVVLSLWSRCIKEKYYKPLYLLLNLIKVIILHGSTATISYLMDDLVVLTQQTADINVISHFNRYHVRRSTASTIEVEAPNNGEVDTHECLQILCLTAAACARRPDDIARFWRSMRFDFISMMLRNIQPIDDVHLILDLLATSIQERTFAMIVPPPANQEASERHIIDRISSLLIEVPKATDGQEPYNAVDIAELRLQVLSLITKLSDKKRSAEAFVRDPFSIGRLVRIMNDELDAIYDYKYGHEYSAEIVNQATRLVYHFATVYSPIINMHEKLQTHPGIAHKYLIALTRLAFSDGTFYEREIEDDVVDCAHQLLEDHVAPEEGEALQAAFSSVQK